MTSKLLWLVERNVKPNERNEKPKEKRKRENAKEEGKQKNAKEEKKEKKEKRVKDNFISIIKYNIYRIII